MSSGSEETAWRLLMKRGDFKSALAISDRIRDTPAADPSGTPRHLRRLWSGAPIDGRRVRVHCYHGLGDTLMFSRFLPPLALRAREVTVHVQPALLPLFASHFASHFASQPLPITWVPLTDDPFPMDDAVDIEIMELPQLFRTTIDTIPPPIPNSADRQTRAGNGAGVTRVGVVWAAGDWDPRRSIPPALLAPLLDVPGLALVSLQQGAVSEHSPHFTTSAERVDRDVMHTVDRMRALDLVISVDSMPAHLAGTLGRPVWLLLHADADWRWMEKRSDSPWYPLMRIFRQPSPGDWTSVIAEVVQALAPHAT